MVEKVILTDDLTAKSYGSYPTNLPNIWCTPYYYEVPNGVILGLDNSRPLHLKITAYKKYTDVDTTQDFTLSADNPLAIVRNPKSNMIEYEWMAIARGRTSGGIVHLASYNPNTLEMTFPAISGSTTYPEIVDVFYILGAGQMRLQLTAPSRAQLITQSVFESSIDAINSVRQNNINHLLRLPVEFELRAGWKLELAIYTSASVILKAQDIPDGNFTTNWNELSIISIPIRVTKEV